MKTYLKPNDLENPEIYKMICEYFFKKCDTISLENYLDQHNVDTCKTLEILSGCKIIENNITNISSKLLDEAYKIFIENNFKYPFLDFFDNIKGLENFIYNEDIFDKKYKKNFEDENSLKNYEFCQKSKKFLKEYPDFETYIIKKRKYYIVSKILNYIYEKSIKNWITVHKKDILNIKINKFDNGNVYSKVYYMKLTDELKKEILSKKSFYNFKFPYFLENISFFKNGYCYLNTIAHEEICEIEITDEEEFEYLKSIGLKFDSNKFISTKEENLFYEDY